VSQCKECTSKLCVEFRQERARRAHQRNHKLKGEDTYRVFEHSEGRPVQGVH
jgi:hypothetical protein